MARIAKPEETIAGGQTRVWILSFIERAGSGKQRLRLGTEDPSLLEVWFGKLDGRARGHPQTPPRCVVANIPNFDFVSLSPIRGCDDMPLGSLSEPDLW